MSALKETKHVWTKEENYLVTLSYLNHTPLEDVCLLVPNIKKKSVKMKYSNCLFLEQGQVRSALKNCSKMHKEIFAELQAQNLELILKPILEPVIEPEFKSGWEDDVEDGEIYFKCTGVCNRICHFEDTDYEGMCGKCQYKCGK